jgi:hypothetical protein
MSSAPEEAQSKVSQLAEVVIKPTANRLDLAGVFALVAPLAATLGLFKATDSIARIQRDEPFFLWLAIALVLIAGTLLTIANFLAGEGESAGAKRWARRLFFAATLCTAVGFMLALGLVFGNAGQESRPQIAATLNATETKLTAHVTATNMKTDHRLAVKVDLATVGPNRSVDSIHPFLKHGSLPLERAFMGPNPDGDVDQQLTLSIPPGGDYTNVVIKAYTGPTNQSCRELAKGADPGTACTILALNPDHGTRQRWREVVSLSEPAAARP